MGRITFFAGAKIGGSKLFGEGGKFLTNLSANEIKTKAMNSAARVMLDGADGGVEGFIQPLLGGIYKKEVMKTYLKNMEDGIM